MTAVAVMRLLIVKAATADVWHPYCEVLHAAAEALGYTCYIVRSTAQHIVPRK
jgi:hypothetical protein